MPLSCLFSQLPGSRLQLWDWTERGGKEWGGPFYSKVKGKIHPAGIRGSLWADLRQPHHRNRKAGKRGAVASRQHWLLAVFGSCLGSEGGRFDSLQSPIHRYLVFWILKPHISCRAFRLALKMGEFMQTIDYYVAYMIYAIIYDDRLCFHTFFFSSVGHILHSEKIC